MLSTLLIHIAATPLLIGLASLLIGQTSQPVDQTSPAVTKSSPATVGSPESITDTASTTDGSRLASAPVEPESFSQLTLFVFGAGLALFIALLAWSDQIRGIDADVRELERRFLEDTGIEKSTFLSIVKPQSPDDRGVALLEVINAGRIKSGDSAKVLTIFTDWHKQWVQIERLSSAKYYVTIILTAGFFVIGTVSLFTNPSQKLHFRSVDLKVEQLILMPAALLIISLLVIIVCIAARESALRRLLKSVSDMV
jgi:hypothetical protein